MQIKNKKKTLFIFLLFSLFFNMQLNAIGEEFNITAKEIIIDKENEILIGTGKVQATDSKGLIINADKITYEKSREFLIAEGSVKVINTDGSIILSSKASYDKPNEIIVTYNNTEVLLLEGYRLVTNSLTYNTFSKLVSSTKKTVLNDSEGNIVETSMFQYHLTNNLFSSVGKIKVVDINKNKYFFKEIHVDTKKREMIGSNVSIILDPENFGTSDGDPRFVANDVLIKDDIIDLSKGVFTVCKLEKDKCPPWSLKAKKIRHDKTKKTIYYDNAILKLYDIPIFYFPKFFHPDQTVKRQSGFLAPFFTNTSTVGTGSAVPYFWSIAEDRDLTFTPKIYTGENILFLNEYRQAFRNGFLTLDTSFTEGYKNTSTTKPKGNRNHVFANLDLNFNKDDSYQSNLLLKVQRTSNSAYFKVHDINTALVDSETTTLQNEIKYSFNKSDTYLDIDASVYENINKNKSSDKYEYILPNIIYGKTFLTKKFGTVDLKSNALYRSYNTNSNRASLTNDLIWNPYSYITKNGFIRSIEGMVRNTNYEARKTNEYKDSGTVNEINSVIAFKSSLPMKKNQIRYSKFFTPNFMIRYAPGHMRNLSGKDIALNYTNLYSLNKTSEIEDGLSAILGFDYKINEKIKNNTEREKISISLGQVFNYEKNNDLPSKSSLDQEMSDVVGEINYNFAEIGKIDYKFNLDHNFNDLNYNDISTELNFGKIQFNLDYLEQQSHMGDEHYASSGITLNINNFNKLSFSTKKNFKTESTELYDISYQYGIDCLTAGIGYRREFYQDADDLDAKNSLMFTISFIPFAKVKSPSLKQ